MRNPEDHRSNMRHDVGYRTVTTSVSAEMHKMLRLFSRAQDVTPGGFMKLAIADRLELSGADVDVSEIGAVRRAKKE